MTSVSKEQIERAKEINILDYLLDNEQDNLNRVGRANYLKDHDSLEISNGLWNWHSQGVGGKNVIDYLIKVRGYDFVSAVRQLAGENYRSYSVAPKARPPTEHMQTERLPFSLPPRNSDNKRVIAYLEQRGIDKDLIQNCINSGILYESATWHNCVFVGRDEDGKAKFAALRGTNSDFKRDATGSDKRYGFCLPPNERGSKTVCVFESPIDALSHKLLCPQVDGYRLSLGGTALAALTRFLDVHKEISQIAICTDNDEAGNSAAAKIAELSGYSVTRLLPSAGKDWNEALQKIRNEVINIEDVRKDIRFINSEYKTLFTVKDGDSIKFTSGYDGAESVIKCRFIDEAHLTLIGKYHNDYHICQLAEMLERNGSKCEPIPGQKPMLNILTAKYDEALKNVEIPMTDAAIKRLVGGKYDVEPLYVDGQGINANYGPQVRGALVRGKDGVAVCGVGGNDNTLTNLHPYWAQKYIRELSSAERPAPPEKADMLIKINKFKNKAAAQTTMPASPEKVRNATAL